MTPEQERLRAAHGTPREFEAAVWRAYADLFVTHDEAVAGIQKYRDEWEAAGNCAVVVKDGEQT
jgi:hypothetical protein